MFVSIIIWIFLTSMSCLGSTTLIFPIIIAPILSATISRVPITVKAIIISVIVTLPSVVSHEGAIVVPTLIVISTGTIILCAPASTISLVLLVAFVVPLLFTTSGVGAALIWISSRTPSSACHFSWPNMVTQCIVYLSYGHRDLTANYVVTMS